MKTYLYRGALYCEHCADRIKGNLRQRSPECVPITSDDESSYDSNDWPKGPFPNGGGEADTPQHCDHCGEFLQNVLTNDGDSWLRNEAAEFDLPDSSWAEIAERAELAGKAHLAEWIRFYLAFGN